MSKIEDVAEQRMLDDYMPGRPTLPATKKVVLEEGDAMLIVRADGRYEACLIQDERKRASIGEMTVIGLAFALENEDWHRALVRRANARIKELKEWTGK